MRGADDRIIEARRTPRGLAALLIGCVVAGALGAEPLVTWSRNLPDGMIAHYVQPAAEGWHATMEGIGATAPYREIRQAVRALESR